MPIVGRFEDAKQILVFHLKNSNIYIPLVYINPLLGYNYAHQKRNEAPPAVCRRKS